ncbi:MAG: hypothetical protein OQL08_06645 [Gammaproteobacteria bacterium]|nr:hypothetical protein [Gammaproteobacteria bacterium]
MDIISPLLVGLILAAITGISYLAVTHLDIFEDISVPLMYGVTAFSLAVIIFISAYNKGLSAAIDKISDPSIAKELFNERTDESSILYIFASLLAFIFYLKVIHGVGKRINANKNQNMK